MEPDSNELHNSDEPRHEHNRTWIFILLLCAVMLLMGVFGFAIFSIYNTTDIAIVEETEVLPEPTENSDSYVNSEDQEDTATPQRITHTKQYPTFTTPEDWNVSVQSGDSDYYITNTLVSNEEIRVCIDCGNYTIPLTITHYVPDFADAPTFEMLQESFNDYVTNEPASDLSVSTSELSNGILYSISGTTPEDLFPPHFEELLLFNGDDGSIVYVRFADFEGNIELVAEWERIKSSIRF